MAISRSLADLLVDSTMAVGFTGAGISTECGIPDFRSPGGLWTTNMPISFGEFCASAQSRREAWRRKFAMEPTFAEARPGRGHKAIAHMVDVGRMSHVITQNIDNLHQAAGVPPERIVELHGNGSHAACLGCRQRYELGWIKQVFESSGDPPDCPACGGLIKSSTISFGQPMPEAEMRFAEEVTLACDLFICIGSSLVVYPAAGLPILAKRNGARLVIINREATQMDGMADLVIRDDIGDALEPLSRIGGNTADRPPRDRAL